MKLLDAKCHEHFKEFLQQKIEHAEIINNILQLIHLMKKQSRKKKKRKISNNQDEIDRIFVFVCRLEHFLTDEQLNEYKPLLETMRINQNCHGKRLIDRTLTVLQNEHD
jgi:hypothetical protein